jgi:phosphatidylserine decarboxylase
MIKIVVTILVILTVFLIYFYRKPAVQTIRANNTDTIFSPCFGTVKKIEVLPNTDQLFVAVFLSPLDIHYQYMPVRGKITNIAHDDIGVYHLAFDMEKSRYNEKMIYTIETENGTLILYQIAGFLVRRIVTELEVGNTYETGETVGMIKFGSRVDILIPNASRFALNPSLTIGTSVTPDMIFGTYKEKTQV